MNEQCHNGITKTLIGLTKIEKLGLDLLVGLSMSHKFLVIQNLSRVDVISKYEICRCPDGKGRLLFDYRKKEYVREGKCKLMLLCTIIHTINFEQKRKRGEFFAEWNY